MVHEIKDSTCLSHQYKLRKKRKLRLHSFTKVNDLASLFTYLIANERATYYVDTGRVQCAPGLYRSTRDMYLTCLHYFPKITYRQFYDALTFVGHKALGWGYFGYCDQARGNTFRFGYKSAMIGIKSLKNDEKLNYKN